MMVAIKHRLLLPESPDRPRDDRAIRSRMQPTRRRTPTCHRGRSSLSRRATSAASSPSRGRTSRAVRGRRPPATRPTGQGDRERERTRVELRGHLRRACIDALCAAREHGRPDRTASSGDVESRILVEIDSSHDLPESGRCVRARRRRRPRVAPSANPTAETVGTTGSSGFPSSMRRVTAPRLGSMRTTKPKPPVATQTLPAPVARPIAGRADPDRLHDAPADGIDRASRCHLGHRRPRSHRRPRRWTPASSPGRDRARTRFVLASMATTAGAVGPDRYGVSGLART